MANLKHLDKIRKGVKAWNKWRAEHDDITPDLSGAKLARRYLCNADLSYTDLAGLDLTEAELAGANLYRANLSNANLSMADLRHANLRAALLERANLIGTNLSAVDLRDAGLGEADLRRASLQGADISGASLFGANFEEAIIGQSSFGNVDLSSVKGLESVRHLGPTTIGIDTLYKSQGKIPGAFLLDCGVPEQLIVYARSLIGQAIEFYSCFISYSSKDQGFAERLHADLRAKALRVWFASEDLKIGDRFQDQIEASIRLSGKIMIILSEASVQSRWVEREVNAGWEREDRDRRLLLFPIRIDDSIMDATAPWAADLRRQRHIGDFSRWKDHDSYQKAFERLLRDLRQEEA